MRKNSVTVGRFSKYLMHIKTAKSDKDILLAGFNLVEEYRGFHYNWLATITYRWIMEGFYGLKRLTQSEILNRKK